MWVAFPGGKVVAQALSSSEASTAMEQQVDGIARRAPLQAAAKRASCSNPR
jgi:hypothetical protein